MPLELVERPLAALEPRWIESVGHEGDGGHRHMRAGVGVCFLCPRHLTAFAWACRLEFFFLHPEDGYGPPSVRGTAPRALYGHAGTLENMSLWSELPAPTKLLVVPGHWAGFVLEGHVWTYQGD